MKVKSSLYIPRLLVFLGCGLFGALALTAQEPGSNEAAPITSNEAIDDSDTVLGTFKKGGLAMYPLLAFSVATLGLIIYNSMIVRSSYIIQSKVVDDQVIPELTKKNYKRAIEICEENPSPLVNTLRNGLETTENGLFDPIAIDKAFDEGASVELAKPFVFINYLQVIASVAPMVGLLGTVSGMVKAFKTIADQGMGKPELLADNISEALITTASGLSVAIPALIAYFYFKNKYGKITSEVAQILGRTLRKATHVS